MAHTIVKERYLLDRYSLTESVNSILNGLIAFAIRERVIELDKQIPDSQRIAELKELQEEVWQLYNDNASFETLERMEELVEHYSPILLASKKKAQTKI